jgi:SAM-dependent methyltransferase
MSSSPAGTPAAGSSEFVGSIPELYDRHLGPFFFAPYAADLASRLKLPTNPSAVLEIAAGTGIVTQELRRRVPSEARLLATDLNASMLAVAEQRVGKQSGVEFREADAQALPFADGMFDAVVCQFGIMFMPDKPLAARAARRVLKRGGQWLFSVWGTLAENDTARVANGVITGFFKNDPPAFYQTPFGFADPAGLRALATDAGFSSVTVTDVPLTGVAVSAESTAIGLVQGNPVVNTTLERGESPAEITRATAAALAAELGDKPLKAKMLARVVSAIK